MKIQKLGKGLAVRMPAKVARSVRFGEGQLVNMAAVGRSVVIKPIYSPNSTLAQKLARSIPNSTVAN